jgi:hypothetical protein
LREKHRDFGGGGGAVGSRGLRRGGREKGRTRTPSSGAVAERLKDEITTGAKRNFVQGQLFSEKLKKTLNAYHNRAIGAVEAIEALARLATELDAATEAGSRQCMYSKTEGAKEPSKAGGMLRFLVDEGGEIFVRPSEAPASRHRSQNRG